MKVKVEDFFLAEGGIQSPSDDFNVDVRRVSQVVNGLRWEEAKIFDRGNVQTTITFSVYRIHDSVADAEVFILDHGANMPGSGEVEFISEGEDALVRVLTASVIEGVLCNYEGVSTNYSYTIIGGKVKSRKILT